MHIVKRLSDFGENNFIKLLDKLVETNTDRNKNWFPILRADYKSRYLEWFFVVDDNTNEFVAFSTIQEFYKGCFRVVTRCYIDNKFRRTVLPKEDEFKSPASLMILDQIAYLKEYDTLFISLEGITRRGAIINMAKKMEITTQRIWTASDRIFQTTPTSWQNVCYTGNVPQLNSISLQEWRDKNGRYSLQKII